MPDSHKNFASSLVATAPSPATSGTSLVVTTGEGTKFPTAPFNATIWPTGANPTTANAEIVRVTAVSTDTLTITRAQEGTSARTVIVGDQIVAGITAKTLTDVEGVFSGFYGDGSDGNVTVTGGTTTLTRAMYYDTLTISGTGVLKPNGFRVFCKTALIVQTSGILSANGNNASGATGGTTSVNGSSDQGGGGPAGATGVVGVGAVGTAASNSYGGASGAGGAGTSGAGGAVRVANAPSSTAGSIRHVPAATQGTLFINAGFSAVNGGAGASAGAGDGSNTGGGGGGGGGVLVLNARAVTNSGTISANGGDGGNSAAGNTGGGGGGGGGVVIINTSTALTGSSPIVNGGAGGSKQGTGVAGSAGSAGTVFVNVWS